jgi:putative DNA primase/helicase
MRNNINGDSYSTYPLTDAGNAERMAEKYGADLKYVSSWKQWLWWTGTHWQRDAKSAIHQAAKATARSIRGEALQAPPEIYARISEWAARSESRWRLEAMVVLAGSEKAVAREASDFDRDPWVLNCSNGTLDLLSGEFQQHSRGDLLTKCLPVEYSPDAACPMWNEFLSKVQPSEEVRSYLQRAAGYSLSGSVEEQCLFFLYGLGANGKTTFLETLKFLLSDYAIRVQSRALLSKSWKSGAGPTPNIARLKGARIAMTSELESGGYLDESLVKDLTGGDTLVARHLHANLFEFLPTHKIWMAGNHKPGIRGRDLAIWRRIRLIPFGVTIPPDEQDKRLMSKLRAEAPGILNWAVEGFRLWRSDSLGEPLEVVQATRDYEAEMDRMGEFVETCCTKGPGLKVRSSHLYQAYSDWCKMRKMMPLNAQNFRRGIADRGFTSAKKSGYSHFLGIALKAGEWT